MLEVGVSVCFLFLLSFDAGTEEELQSFCTITISYHSENHFRTITISYHCHFVPYADRYIITISYHMQIDTLWPFRTICRSIHYMTISYHMQFDTIDDHFVPYAESYEDSTFILILHHIQINVIPKYMLHVGTVKSMYLRRGKKYTCIYISIINFIKCSVISAYYYI